MRGPNDMGAWILVGVTALNFGLQPVDTDAEERDAKAEAEQDAKDAADREAEQDAKDAAKAKDKAAADEQANVEAQKKVDADAEAKQSPDGAVTGAEAHAAEEATAAGKGEPQEASGEEPPGEAATPAAEEPAAGEDAAPAAAAAAPPAVEIVEEEGSDCVLVSGNGLEVAVVDGALTLAAGGGTRFAVLAAGDGDDVMFEHEGESIELGPNQGVWLKQTLPEGEVGEESQRWTARYVEDYVYVESVSVAGHVLDVGDGKLAARPRDDARAEQRFRMRLGADAAPVAAAAAATAAAES
jgi:hypothetical protein